MLAGLDAYTGSFLADLSNTESRISAANLQLSSGYRVNEASDDPGAIASIIGYQSQIDNITQVQTNLNQASTVASVADGALSTTSTLLNQLTSIAAQGSNSTTTASTRTILAQRVQAIAQQLVGIANTSVQGKFIFGGDAPATQPYTYNWSSPGGAVPASNVPTTNTATIQDASGAKTIPGLTARQIFGSPSSGASLAGNSQVLTALNATFVVGASPADDQTFHFNVFSGGAAIPVSATVAASAAGQSLGSVLTSLNSQLNSYGITAGVDSNGQLQFTGAAAFTVNDNPASSGTQLLTNDAGAGTAANLTNFTLAGQATYAPAAGDTLKFATGSGGSVSVTLAPATSLAAAITQINASTASLGVYAVANAAGTGISFQSQTSFTVTNSSAGTFAAAGTNTAAAPATAGILQTVYQLGIALQNNDAGGVQASNTALQASVTQLGQTTTSYGNTETWIQVSQNSAAASLTDFQSALSGLRGANTAQQATELTTDETALQAALSAQANLNIKSLFSYLG
jgi:flagellin-like hook-associated protein FlgL